MTVTGLSTMDFTLLAFFAAILIHQIIFFAMGRKADYLSASVFITGIASWLLTKDLGACAFSTLAAFVGHFLSVGVTQTASLYKKRIKE